MLKKLSKNIKRQFFTGLIVILPLGLTVWIVSVLFGLIGNRFLPLFKSIPLISALHIYTQMVISAALTFMVIWFVGLWTRNLVGRTLIRWTENFLMKVPVISKIYKTIRKITDTMFVNKQAFKKVAAIEYPRKGIYTIVFVTNETVVKENDKYITVFVPSTPNPTTGYCIVLPESDIIVLPITINQAMEFILSFGIIVPAELDLSKLGKKKSFFS
ncbi:DUF502 domain-containing protein [Elusimicrobiota bacterium]